MSSKDQEQLISIGPLSQPEREEIRMAVIDYHNWVSTNISNPVEQIFKTRPRELTLLFDSLNTLIGEIQQAGADFNIHLGLLPILKQSVIQKRRTLADAQDEQLSKTFNPGIREDLQRRIAPIEKMMTQDWFKDAEGVKPPKLTDFLSIQHAENHLKRYVMTDVKEREFDEKFNILTAPAFFLPDLESFRIKCELRGRPLCVAFIDIDDFKRFNTEYGEPKVDRDVLPLFMTALEAHTFFHGYSYRFGGDEYMVLLPNMSSAQAAAFLKEFQIGLEELTYFEVEMRPTVSIGVVEVRVDCPLTNAEIQERAARAKMFAKDAGKNRIGGYEGFSYSEDTLVTI